MERTTSSPAEVNSIDILKKKRKLHDEQQEMPLRKHVCWGQIPDGDFSSHYATEPKVESDKIARGGGESDPESANDSNSFHCNGDDCIMSTDDEANTNLEHPETHASEEPSTSSTNWASTSSDMKLYSLESRSLTKSNSSQTESLSLCEQFYEENLPEFGSHDENCSCSGCGNDEIEQYTDKEFENLLYSNGVDPSNYVLSSGRWSVNQDTQQEGKKLTIDKEFEQYFSMLMM